MKKKCPECGADVLGRSDKIFCSDACRNANHNRRNKDHNNAIRTINNKLRKNYRILTALTPKQTTKTSKQRLLKLGFNFQLFTSVHVTKEGKVYHFVYDRGYLALEDDSYALVQNKNKLVHYDKVV